jgi:hypothetical protein
MVKPLAALVPNNGSREMACCPTAPRPNAPGRLKLPFMYAPSNCSHDKSMRCAALMAYSLIVGRVIYKLGYGCRAPCVCVFTQKCPPLFSSLGMYASSPHATSASVWVAVGRPRATDWGGVLNSLYIGDTADYNKVKVLCYYAKLPSAGELSIAARRNFLSRVSDLRRGPITC